MSIVPSFEAPASSLMPSLPMILPTILLTLPFFTRFSIDSRTNKSPICLWYSVIRVHISSYERFSSIYSASFKASIASPEPAILLSIAKIFLSGWSSRYISLADIRLCQLPESFEEIVIANIISACSNASIQLCGLGAALPVASVLSCISFIKFSISRFSSSINSLFPILKESGA